MKVMAGSWIRRLSRRPASWLVLSIILTASAPAMAAAPAAESDTEVAELRARVAALEAQNRAILEALEALRGDLAAAPPAPAPANQAAASPSPPTATAEAGPASTFRVGQDSEISFYGFIRLDAIFDDSRPNSIQSPNFILSEAPGAEDEDSFTFHPRLTRFGFDYDGPRIGTSGPELAGKIEIDFQNGGGEARQLMRMRHAYMTLDWEKTRLLFGQTWDLISPLYPTVNADTMMWNTGNLGDRRPQIRGRYQRKTEGGGSFSLEGGLGLSGAIDSQDLDRNGVRDGDDGLFQNLQARVAFGSSSGSGSWTLGVHGLFGREETEIPVAGHDTFDSDLLGVDFAGKWGKVGVKGEWWTGSNLDDFRGGVGQGVNTATGEEIDSSGGWLELGLDFSDTYSFFVGYAIDDPSDGDLPAGGRTKNEAWFLVNRFRVARPFVVGIDYLSWETSYKGLPKGDDNRLNLYFIYNF